VNYGSYQEWATQIADANHYYKNWETRYKCQTLVDYYKGFQWRNKVTNINTLNYRPYTINLTYSTIKIKIANFLFQNPTFLISPRPTTFWNPDSASLSASIKQDALNAIISNRKVKFNQNVKRAALDSFFRFGVLEVGYAADWRNPNKMRPHLKSDDDSEIDITRDRVIDQNEIPEEERIYVKRVKPSRFRICVSDELELDELDWYGYFEYYNKRVLMKTKGIDFPTTEKGISSYSAVSSTVGDSEKFEDREWQKAVANQDIVKCWHIWSPLKKKRYLIMDDGCFLLWEGDFERSPLITIRWDDDLDHWYPVPPVFQWLSSQDEINEAREQTRSFRRRFTRKFQVLENRVDPEEVEKFVSGPDGVAVTVKQQDAILPIQNPEQGVSAENALLVAKDDFNIITGTSAEARGQGDRETATEARLKDSRSQIRESADQLDFATFMADVGREVLLTASEKLTAPLWIKYTNTDSQDSTAWRVISADQLSDGYDFDIKVDITNATPAAMAMQEQAYMKFVSIVSQYPLVQLSPDLIRETALRVGYQNERIIKQMQQAAINQLRMQAAQMQQSQTQAGNGINAGRKAIAAQQSSPSPNEVDKQIANQIQ